MKRILILAAIAATFGIASACSSATETTKTNQTTATTTNANTANKAIVTTANTAATNSAPTANANTADEAPPESVKAAFTDASGGFKKEHKNMTPTQIEEITKTAGVKPPDTDHHYFAAFSTSGGGRKQIGAATIVNANGKDIVVVYENKEGKPFIKEVRADGVPAAFLSQFVGKSHDDKMQIGADLKANGVDDKTAKTIADAVRVDAVTMQILYGAKDSH